MRTTYSGLVDEKLIGQTVTLYGWAHRRRDHGGVIFIDLRDREGLVQVVCDPDRPDVFATADKVRNEFCLAVVGVVRARPEGTKNEHLISGGVEVLCQKLEILNPSLPPPFQLDDDTVSESARLTYRVLDLRRQQMQRNLKLRFKVAQAFRHFLDENGFIDYEDVRRKARECRPQLILAGASAYSRIIGFPAFADAAREAGVLEKAAARIQDPALRPYYRDHVQNMMDVAKQYEAALPYIEDRRLDAWTHNKAIQKSIESRRITDGQKAYLRSLKLK